MIIVVIVGSGYTSRGSVKVGGGLTVSGQCYYWAVLIVGSV